MTEQIDWRGKAVITSGMRLGRSAVLRSLKLCLRFPVDPVCPLFRKPGIIGIRAEMADTALRLKIHLPRGTAIYCLADYFSFTRLHPPPPSPP